MNERGDLSSDHADLPGDSAWGRASALSYGRLQEKAEEASSSQAEESSGGPGQDSEALKEIREDREELLSKINPIPLISPLSTVLTQKWSSKVDEDTKHPLCLVCGNKCAGTTGGELWCCTCGAKLGS